MKQLILMVSVLLSLQLSAQQTVSVTFDNQGRLKSEKYAQNFELYTNYDVEGNITSQWFVDLKDPGTFIPENENALQNISIYPNPVTNKLTIKISDEGNEDIAFTIFNYEGKEVFYQETKNRLIDIDFDLFSAGLYLVKVETIKSTRVYKIVKE